MAQRFVLPLQTIFDALGTVADGAQVYFYASGTSSPLDTFSDQALSIPNTNPVVADSAGLLPDIWLQPLDYKVVAKTADDVELWTADPVSALGADGSDLTVTPTGAATSRTLADMAADELDVKAFGAVADAKTGADGVSTDASAAFTSAAGNFAAADIGKDIVIEGAGAGTAITGAADNGGGLIRITATAHGKAHGQTVTIKDVVGTTEANASWAIDLIDADTIDLRGSTFTNAYTSGGTVHGALSTIISVVTSNTQITLSTLASASGTGLPYAYGTDNSAAILAADAVTTSQGLWFRYGNYFVNANTVISSDMVFDPGAVLIIPRGIAVTPTGVVRSGHYQIFDVSVGGSVDLTNAVVDPLSLELWGTNYSEGAQAVFGSVARDNPIQIPLGSHLISTSPSAFGRRMVWDIDSNAKVKGSNTAEITNGNFTLGIGSWSDQSTGTASISHDAINKRLQLNVPAASIGWAQQAVTTSNVGRKHVLEYEFIGNTADETIQLRIGTTSTGDEITADLVRDTGIHRHTFTPTASPFYVQFRKTLETIVWVDNVKLIEPSPLNIPNSKLGKIDIGSGIYTPTSNYQAGESNLHIRAVAGLPWSPTTSNSAVAIFQKHGSGNTTDHDTTVYISQVHYGTDNHQSVPLFVEMQDQGGGPGSFVESGRLHSLLNPVMTAVSAAIQDDGGVFTDETTEANEATANDMNLLPAVPVATDAYLFGASTEFSQLRLEMGTAGAGTYTITWKYWNGAWTALTGVRDGTSDFKTTGTRHVTFTVPGDWATTTINSQGPFYYIKAEVDGGTTTTIPLGSQAWTTETGRSNGFVTFAGTNVIPEYLIGHESSVQNNSGWDASSTWSASENSTCFLATGSSNAGSGAIHSWYSTWGQSAGVTDAHVGYLVAPNRTTGAAFRSLASTTLGLDLSLGSQSDAAILLPNNTAIKSRNAGDSASHSILIYNAANQLAIGADAVDIKWGRALIALGGGAAPTFGTIGGSGPTAAAQNSWLRFIDSGGTAAWIPVWK